MSLIYRHYAITPPYADDYFSAACLRRAMRVYTAFTTFSCLPAICLIFATFFICRQFQHSHCRHADDAVYYDVVLRCYYAYARQPPLRFYAAAFFERRRCHVATMPPLRAAISPLLRHILSRYATLIHCCLMPLR